MKSGTELSRADNLNGAQTGTCFKAGPLAFTATGKALVEVIEVPEISPVGGTQGWFAGLIIYRSELLPVTDFTRWAGLAEKTGANREFASGSLRASPRQTAGSSRIKQRILVVQHPDDYGDQAEKIGLLVDEVSGHVVLDQASTMKSDRHELAVMLREQLNINDTSTRPSAVVEPSQHLLELVKGAWSSPARVFLVELQQLFAMDAFTTIATHSSNGARVRREPEVLYS